MVDTIIYNTGKKKVRIDGNICYKSFTAGAFSKADILNEALNQTRVEATPLNVPSIIAITKVNDEWTIEMEYKQGKNLLTLLDENPDKLEEYLTLYVDTQSKILDTPAPAMLNKLKDKMHGKIDKTDLDSTTKYELHERLNGLPTENFLCHGDFQPDNLIVNDKGEVAIIDWSHVTCGNQAADIARSYLCFCLAGKTEIAEKYLTKICEKRDIPRSAVNKWLPIVAASQSVKGKNEMLSEWIHVVEFE